MRTLALVLAISLCGFSAAVVRAQSPRVEQLRRQIDALEQQLADAEVSADRHHRVAEIGDTRRPERSDLLVVRLYDLGDLFATAPPYIAHRLDGLGNSASPLFSTPPAIAASRGGAMGGMGGMGGGMFSVPDSGAHLPSPKQNVLFQQTTTPMEHGPVATFDSLISAITTTIDPSGWDEVGGPGSIAQLGYALIISTTPANHAKIEKLLESVRGRWGTLRTISVRAWWLWLDTADADRLLTGADVEPAQEGALAFGLVDAKRWQELLAKAEAAKSADERGYRAALTCYNGQTVSTQAARQSVAVTDLVPTSLGSNKEGKATIAYAPKTTVLQEGVTLQLTPGANTSGKFVILDVRSQISRLKHPPRPKAGESIEATNVMPQDLAAAIDRPELVTQELSTTLRLPVDRVMLIGGMTFAEAAPADRSHLVLFVRASVQELRDDKAPKDAAATDQPEP